MSINTSKTFYVHFGTQNPAAKYFISNVEIQTTKCARDLGLYFNNALSVSNHVDIVCSKGNKRMHSILKNFYSNDEEILIPIFNIYVRQIFTYGSPIFNVYQKQIIENLEYYQR